MNGLLDDLKDSLTHTHTCTHTHSYEYTYEIINNKYNDVFILLYNKQVVSIYGN
jgi:hypothetical protein